MRHYKKLEVPNQPQVFLQWKEENIGAINNWIEDDSKKPSIIWDELGQTFNIHRETQIESVSVRNDLLNSLFSEQHGLCCYCGNNIKRELDNNGNWKYKEYAIEHFKAKNSNRTLIFDYNNLMLCCKESTKCVKYEVGRNGINSFEDVATSANLDVEIIKNFKSNRGLARKEQLEVTDTIKIPNPEHCDDSKSKFDSQEDETIIINPTSEDDIQKIESLKYIGNGEIIHNSTSEADIKVIENSIKVLSLNCDTLKDFRKKKYDAALDNFNTIVQTLNEDADVIKSSVIKLIAGKSKPDDEGILEPFYFVEIDFLKNILKNS